MTALSNNPWRRDYVIIGVLMVLFLAAAGVGIWRYSVHESYEAERSLKSPYFDRLGAEGETSSVEREPVYKAVYPEANLDIPLSLKVLHKLAGKGNGCVAVLISIHVGRQLIAPVFNEQSALSPQWQDKGAFKLPIVATDFCSISAEGDKFVSLPVLADRIPPTPDSAARRAVTFLAEWSQTRRESPATELPFITKLRQFPVDVPEGKLAFNLLVPRTVPDKFGVRLRYVGGGAVLAGVWFPTEAAENIVVIGRPADFEAVFGGKGEYGAFPMRVRRSNVADAGANTALTVATRVIAIEIEDARIFKGSDDWPDQLTKLFMPTGDKPYFNIWRLGPDGCEKKEKRSPREDMGYVRVSMKADSWRYLPVLERCGP